MRASSSRVFDRAVYNFDTEFDKCVLLNLFREFSDESIGVDINIYSIFNMYDGSSWSW